MTPAENFDFLNAYLRRVAPAIKQNKGFVSQYFGDGIMALFLNKSEDAVRAAVEMQRKLKDYNEERKKKSRNPRKKIHKKTQNVCKFNAGFNFHKVVKKRFAPRPVCFFNGS